MGSGGTGIQPLARVRPDVSLQIAGFCRRIRAVGALVRPLARVRPNVLLQVPSFSRCIRAVRALVRPLARVRAHVLLQVPSFSRCIRAVRALVWPLARVRAHVPRQLRGARKRCAALAAAVPLLGQHALVCGFCSALGHRDCKRCQAHVVGEKNQGAKSPFHFLSFSTDKRRHFYF
jgi:hypothetical protein